MRLGLNKLILYSNGKAHRLVMGGQAKSAKYVTYYIDSGSAKNVSYDEGANVLSPEFTPYKSGWTFVGWREDTTANSKVLSSKTMGTENIKLYAVYQRTTTLTYYDNSTTAKTKTGTSIFNAAGNYSKASFVMTQSSKSGWTARGWSTSAVADASVTDANGTAILTAGDITLYGLYYQTVTNTFVSYDSTQYASGTRYYNSSGALRNATVTTPSGAAYSGWTWRGWSSANDTSATASPYFSNGVSMAGCTTNATYYGLYQKKVTATFISHNSAQEVEAYKLYNASGNESNPNVTCPAGASYSGWTWYGWSAANDTRPGTNAQFDKNSTIENLWSDFTYYGLYCQTIYLYYNGNGSTSGFVSTQSGARYFNSYGTESNPSFTLASNGFTRTNYNFTGWDLGSPGTTVTLSASATAYAQWELASIPYYAVQNGTAVNLPNANISMYGDYWGQSEGNTTCSKTGTAIWGVNMGVRSTNTHTGCTVDTGNMSTQLCKYMTVTSYSCDWGQNYWHGATFILYGDGSEIKRWDEVRDIDTDTPSMTTQQIDISSYSNIRIVATDSDSCDEGENITIVVGFINIQFHN